MTQQCDIVLSLFKCKSIDTCRQEVDYWLYFMKYSDKITEDDLAVIKEQAPDLYTIIKDYLT